MKKLLCTIAMFTPPVLAELVPPPPAHPEQVLSELCESKYASKDQEPTSPIYNKYQSPLPLRYSRDGKISHIFSMQNKHETWRRVWVALAKAQKDVGLSFIEEEQIAQLESNVGNIDFEKAKKYEDKFHHDVVAHLHTFGDQCPQARGIIHLGATSCLVTDNADIIMINEALEIVQVKLTSLIEKLARRAEQYKDLACVSYTHLQPAQPTTLGKRICLWLQDFVLDLKELAHVKSNLELLGAKGATGTAASFLKLFDGDHQKVKLLEERFAHHLGFSSVLPIASQTYTRKQDVTLLNLMSSLAVSAHKMSTDLRLLSHMQELEEPHSALQVGSSAMPYKKNPILCERVCSLSRYVLSLAQNAPYTASTQWLERTLDDSANRRMMIPESFLAIDGILDLLCRIVEKMVVYPEIIKKNLDRELPFMATENILMAAAQKGAGRQEMHEFIRQNSNATIVGIKNGGDNDLLERIASDPRIPLSKKEIESIIKVEQFVGRAPQQVEEFLAALHLPT